MTRKECLEQAMGCVLRDRNNAYGGPEDSFGMIAGMWTAYLGVAVDKVDVAMMMGMLKMARIRGNKHYGDGYIDLAGYAACAAECSGIGTEVPPWAKLVGKEAEEPEGNHPENPDSSTEARPEFNPRDRVQAKMGDGKWRDAFVSGKEIVSGKLHYTVGIHGFDGYYSFPAEDIRPAPRAEGCEDLVQKDAPATTQELYDRIVDCNPSVYPRKPTGEELAEMAEEDAHG